ncbi:HAD-IIIA family hydrolase [Paralcaligenes ginsengisoli]|jgi:3-deoxy-D-manno-octulosonate 8-phosphate phosphatase (KDO 8-P phosphatase)
MKSPTVPHPAEALVLAKIAPAVIERANRIRIMAFDVDGVLTDGRLWYGEHGEAFKSFNVLDGHGLSLLRESGITIALITGRQGPILARRAAELGISIVLQGVRDKATALVALAQQHGCTLEQVGFMGDDIIDLAAMQRAGLAISVPNAPIYVAQAAHWVTATAGGFGAVRECCDVILAAQGRLRTFFASRPFTTSGPTQ